MLLLFTGDHSKEDLRYTQNPIYLPIYATVTVFGHIYDAPP